MKYRNLIGVFVIASISGCASTMSEKEYQTFSSVAGATVKCFEAEYLSPQLYAEVINGLRYINSGWSYDQDKMTVMMHEAYSNFSATAENCRQVEAAAYLVADQSEKHRTNVKQNQEAFERGEINPAQKNTVDCKKVGEFLNAEIKTFSGTVCPTGWFKAY